MPDEGRLKLCYRSRPCSRASLKIALLGRPDLAGSTVPPCQAAQTNPLPGLRCVAQKCRRNDRRHWASLRDPQCRGGVPSASAAAAIRKATRAKSALSMAVVLGSTDPSLRI